jgi:hypothetical protein
MGEAHAMKQAKDIKWGLRRHRREHFAAWEVFHADHKIGA